MPSNLNAASVNSTTIASHLAKVDPAEVTDTLIVAFADQTGSEPVDFIRAAPSYIPILLSELKAEQEKSAMLSRRLEANIRTITEFNLALAEYGTQTNDPLILQNLALCIDQVKQRNASAQKQGGVPMLTREEMEALMAAGGGKM